MSTIWDILSEQILEFAAKFLTLRDFKMEPLTVETKQLNRCGLNVIIGVERDAVDANVLRELNRRMSHPRDLRNEKPGSVQDCIWGFDIAWRDGEPVGGTSYQHGTSHLDRLNAQKQRLIRHRNIPKMDKPLAFVQLPGTSNYFHWMIEILPRIIQRDMFFPKDVQIALRFKDKPRFVTDSLELFCPAEKIYYLDKAFFSLPAAYFVDINDWINVPAPRVNNVPMKRTRMSFALSETIKDFYAPKLPPRKKDLVVFFSRKTADHRKIVNEDMLLKSLREKYEVQEVTGDELTLEEQVDICSQASVIMGAHGAALTNLVFAPKGCLVIEVTGESYVARTNSFYDSSILAGHKHVLVVVDQVGNKEIKENIGPNIRVPNEAMEKIKDAIESHLSGEKFEYAELEADALAGG